MVTQQDEQDVKSFKPDHDDDPDISSIAFFGIVGTLAIYVIVVLLQALYYNATAWEREAKVAQGVNSAGVRVELARVLDEQDKAVKAKPLAAEAARDRVLADFRSGQFNVTTQPAGG